MKASRIFFLALGSFLMAANPVKEDPSKDELDKLRGTWLTVSLVNDGKTLVDEKNPPKDGPMTKLVYEGTKWTIKVGEKAVAGGILKIDPAKKPKEIDIMDESGTKNDKTKLGIYEIDGDTYKFCLATAGKPRPTEFTSKEGSGHSLGMMKREKP
jgi:uncharacterized protein (TIGR03067 family)